jgi:malate dehydrogenase (oxaloacetate-decarboxylating)(NADP+)
LPVHIDVGTNNAKNLEDPAYLGLRCPRVRGEEFFSLVAEFMLACKDKYGEQVLIQFEDFGNATAFLLLEEHRLSSCCFNDDVQGTASVVLAGLISSLPICKKTKVS